MTANGMQPIHPMKWPAYVLSCRDIVPLPLLNQSRLACIYEEKYKFRQGTGSLRSDKNCTTYGNSLGSLY